MRPEYFMWSLAIFQLGLLSVRVVSISGLRGSRCLMDRSCRCGLFVAKFICRPGRCACEWAGM